MKKTVSLLLCLFILFSTFITVNAANELSGAKNYTLGSSKSGSILEGDESDIYKFELANPAKISINLSANIYCLNLKLYDENGKEIWYEQPYWNNTTEEISFQKDLFVNKGKYFFSVSKWSGEGEYSFKFLFTSANESFSEEQGGSNNKTNSANIIAINQKYIGFIGLNDNVDVYRIVISDSSVSLNLSANIYRLNLKMFDENGKEIWSQTPYWNNTTEEISFSKELKLAAGLYYLTVSDSSVHGSYTFWFTNGGYVSEPKIPETIITVTVNGKKISFDQAPTLENGRTLVPLRAIFEALGAEVLWNDDTQTVTATKGSTEISLQIGSTQMNVNGAIKTLDVPAKLINSRTLVPVRAISEAFGCKVDWDQDTQTVLITSK